MGKFKRTTASILSMGMVFTSVPYAVLAAEPASGISQNQSSASVTQNQAVTKNQTSATSISQNQAIEFAKKYVTIPEGYQLRNASFHDAKDGTGPYNRGSVWMLNFGKEQRFERGNINIVVDATDGTLLNFDYYEEEDTKIADKISREDARAKALEYLKKMATDKVDQVKEAETEGDYQIYGPYGSRDTMQMFGFERIVNGIPYPSNSITIRVNGKGEIRGYSFNWTDNVQFVQIQPSVTAEQAGTAFKNALNLQLQYAPVRKPYQQKVTEAQLLYGPWNSSFDMGPLPMIDAVKGVAIDRSGNPLPAVPTLEFKPIADNPGSTTIPTEITKEAALKLIADYKLSVEGYTLENVTYDSYDDRKAWRFQYRQGDPNNPETMRNLSIGIDAKTGELIEFFNYGYQEGSGEFPENPAVSEEQAGQIAIEFVKRTVPNRAHQIALNPMKDQYMGGKMGPGYAFEFVGLVNGIPARELGVRMVIDPNTGSIREFNRMGPGAEDMTYPPVANIMGVEEAKAKFQEKYKLRLQYVPIYEKGKTPYESGKPSGVALVYAPANFNVMQYLNAQTGEWVSLWGEVPPEQRKADDIKGHWAEEQLQYLIDRGIFEVKDGKVEPNTGVTRGEMVKYLLLSVDGPRQTYETASFADVQKTDPNFNYIEEAAARKWISRDIKNFRPNDVITREELADLVTSVLGYEKLADAKNAFKNLYPDVNADGTYMGDIAIATALGIMSGWEGKFVPNGQVSKAQAAIVITKMLDQLKERQQYRYYISK